MKNRKHSVLFTEALLISVTTEDAQYINIIISLCFFSFSPSCQKCSNDMGLDTMILLLLLLVSIFPYQRPLKRQICYTLLSDRTIFQESDLDLVPLNILQTINCSRRNMCPKYLNILEFIHFSSNTSRRCRFYVYLKLSWSKILRHIGL